MQLSWNSFRTHFMMIVFSLIMIYPVVWWIGASLKTNEEMSSPNLFPSVPQWVNYIEGWKAIPNYTFTHFFMNTFELIFGLLITTLISSSLVAFGFARLEFVMKKFWFAILLVTIMLPSQVIIVPQYILFNQLGWVDTYLPFIVPHSLAGGAGGSFFVFLLIQFIRGLPRELDESATIDGCTTFGIYWRIMLPLLRPALVTVAIYCFLWNWDDFFGQLIYINSIEKFTVGLALKMFVDAQEAVPWGYLLAMSLLSIIPSTAVFFLAQRHIVDGIATTGIKG